MAPELLLGSDFSLKSDIWAFGVTMWEVLTLAATPYYNSKRAVSLYSFASIITADNDSIVASIKSGTLPANPTGVSDEVLSIYQACWREKRARPVRGSDVRTLLLILL